VVDVRDIADAHVESLIREDSGGQRFAVCASAYLALLGDDRVYRQGLVQGHSPGRMSWTAFKLPLPKDQNLRSSSQRFPSERKALVLVLPRTVRGVHAPHC
jgi:hypothetical protein